MRVCVRIIVCNWGTQHRTVLIISVFYILQTIIIPQMNLLRSSWELELRFLYDVVVVISEDSICCILTMYRGSINEITFSLEVT